MKPQYIYTCTNVYYYQDTHIVPVLQCIPDCRIVYIVKTIIKDSHAEPNTPLLLSSHY